MTVALDMCPSHQKIQPPPSYPGHTIPTWLISLPSLLPRYRVRKRAELDSLEEELHGLEGQNRELRDKAESVEREIQYVKDLLIEVYKARSQRLKQDGSA